MNDDPLGKVKTMLLNRYRVTRYLGSGGFAHVYLAYDHDLKREVALKITHHKGETGGILSEAQALSQCVKSGRVLTFYGLEWIDGLQTLVTEYSQGGALSARLKDKTRVSCWPLPAIQSVDLLSQVCQGLEEVHNLGWVHRDVKPENILLSEPDPLFGIAKLADFGIAKNVQGSLDARTKIGSFAYIAPEIHSGKGATKRSDIFSVGVTLYRLVTGKFPYDTSLSQQECVNAKLNGDLIPISIFIDVDPRLQKVIAKAVEADPLLRHETASELRDALESVLIDLSVEEALKAFRQTAKYADAESAIGKLSVRFPNRIRPYLELAKLYMQTGNGSRAATVYQAAARRIPEDSHLLFEMAIFSKTVENDPIAAIVHMRRALKQDKGQFDAKKRSRAEGFLETWTNSIGK